MKMKVRGALMGALGMLSLLALPVVAPAQAAGDSDVPAGITISGIGFAVPEKAAVGCAAGKARKRASQAANSKAVDRAIGDARGRAGAIARALGARVGELSKVRLHQLTQFESDRFRGRSAKPHKPSCRAPVKAAAATVTFAIAGGADGSATSRRIEATGASSVEVEPTNPKRNAAIKRAMLAARKTATPEAATAARREAKTAALSAGLELGGLISVSETKQPLIESLFGDGLFFDDALGSFGPARFCRFVRRPVVRRDPETGRPYVKRGTRKYRCAFARSYRVSLDVAYEAG